jgi:hypothetical protein
MRLYVADLMLSFSRGTGTGAGATPLPLDWTLAQVFDE